MRLILAALTLIAFAANDCPAGDKAKGPEAVIGAFTTAAKKEDMKALLSHLTKDSQSVFAAGMIAMTDMYKASAKVDREKKIKLIDELLARHGIDEDTPAKIKRLERGKDPKLVKSYIAAGAALKDKVAFLEDMARLIPNVDERGNNPFNDLAAATIKEVRIDGDRARGLVIRRPTPPDLTIPFFFRVEDGAWKIDLVRTVEEDAVREKKDKVIK